MDQVTVTGGVGHLQAMLSYSAHDIAFIQAQAFANVIDNTYKTAIYYNPVDPPLATSPGYLVIQAKFASALIDARGFGAVVDENNTTPSAVLGGGSKTGQTVLAGSGGLYYLGTSGNNTVVAGGGKNSISFAGDTGNDAAYTSTGNDTIIGGLGNTTVSAGGGDNRVYLQGGKAVVDVSGKDTISLGITGSDTVDVHGNGSALVLGPSSGVGAKLTFIGGTKPAPLWVASAATRSPGARAAACSTAGPAGTIPLREAAAPSPLPVVVLATRCRVAPGMISFWRVSETRHLAAVLGTTLLI